MKVTVTGTTFEINITHNFVNEYQYKRESKILYSNGAHFPHQTTSSCCVIKQQLYHKFLIFVGIFAIFYNRHLLNTITSTTSFPY